MAQRRQRHLRRNLLAIIASLVAHVGLFLVAASEFNFYRLPQESEPAVQIEIVPQPIQPMPPIPPTPPVKVKAAPTPPSPPPAPTSQVQPKPQPPTPAKPVSQTTAAPTAPTQAAHNPTPAPKPAPAPAPAPLTPPVPAPAPGPPRVVSRATVVQSQARTVSAPRLVLHKNQQAASAVAPVSIPGAIIAPTAPTGPGAGAPAGGQAAGPAAPGFPGGALPGFGSGLRGGLLGCANAEALHLSAAERARCAQAFGEGAKESPQMSAIDASKRDELDREAASETAAQKYRDSTPSGSYVRPIPGQPHLGQSPGQ